MSLNSLSSHQFAGSSMASSLWTAWLSGKEGSFESPLLKAILSCVRMSTVNPAGLENFSQFGQLVFEILAFIEVSRQH